MVDALHAEGIRCWVDWRDIRPSAEWMQEVEAAIDAAGSVVFVVSPDSVASSVCGEELSHAESSGKRIVPIVARDTSPELVPASVSRRNWIFFKDEDRFAASIEQLLGALRTDPEWAAMHARLLVRAREWESAGADPSFLLRGRDLRDGEDWLSSVTVAKEPQPSPLHTEYVISSRRAATRGQRVRAAILLVGMVVALGLALVALIQRNRAEDEARVAKSGELAARSLLLSETRPDLGLAVAVEAARTEQTPLAERAIRAGLEETSSLSAVLRGHDGAVNSVDLAPGGDLIASGADDGKALLWDGDGEIVADLQPAAGAVKGVAFSPDGSELVLALGGGGVEVVDVPSLEVSRTAALPGTITSVAINSAGMIAAAGARGAYLVPPDGRGARTPLRGHKGIVYGVAFDSDGRRVVTAGSDGTARVWSAQDGQLVRKLDVSRAAGSQVDVNAASFDSTGRNVVTADDGGVARIWSVSSGRSNAAISASRDQLRAARLSSDGLLLLTGGADDTARVWDPTGGGVDPKTRERRGLLLATLKGHDGLISAADLSEDGETAVTASVDGTVRVWDSDPDDASVVFTQHRGPVYQVAYEPNGERLISAGVFDGSRIWSTGGSELESFTPPTGVDGSIDAALSPDGSRAITADFTDVGRARVRLWDVATGHELMELGSSDERPNGVEFTPDGESVVIANRVGGRGSVVMRDLDSGRVERRMPTSSPLYSLDVSADGKLIAAGGEDGRVIVWDAETGSLHRALRDHGPFVRSVAFNAEGTELASAGDDRVARVWDLASGDVVATMRGHSAAIQGVAFSPDGSSVATASVDRTVRVWSAESGEIRDVLRGYHDWVLAVDYSPNGDLIASGGYEGSARIFRCELCRPFSELLVMAEERVDEILTRREREGALDEA